MAVKIRLRLTGRTKRPSYQIVIANSRSPRDGKHLELVGTYNPLLKDSDPNRINIAVARIQDWQSKGAQMTERVAKLYKEFTSKLATN